MGAGIEFSALSLHAPLHTLFYVRKIYQKMKTNESLNSLLLITLIVYSEWMPYMKQSQKEKKSETHTNNTQRATNGNKSAHKVTAVYVENKRSAQHFTG